MIRPITNLPSDLVIGQLRRMERDKKLPTGTLISSCFLTDHVVHVPAYWSLTEPQLREYAKELREAYRQPSDGVYTLSKQKIIDKHLV